ncbi:MAG: GAF domain-containing protein, partial [Acidimicrobiales bacterium]
LRAWSCPYTFSSFWAVQAFGRVAQALSCEPEERSARLRIARRAVTEMRIAARTPLLMAYYFAAKTGYLIAAEKYSRALKVSARGQAILVGQDAPGVEGALSMARSRALMGVGYTEEADRMAVAAGRVAEDLGVSGYVRWIQPDIADAAWRAGRTSQRGSTPTPRSGDLVGGLLIHGEGQRAGQAWLGHANGVAGVPRDAAGRPGGVSGLVSAGVSSGHHRPRSLGLPAGGGPGPARGAARAARQLEALLQVGAAAARVLDPEELIRLALDETVRILNAERALLFLTTDGSGAVHPHIGRDASGNDISELAGYSSTIVNRVAASHQPIVLTGTEEGAALGSESAVTHGLRSILVAPLIMEDRILGVVYLDSRLAKGIFTHDDVEILSAITSHVAFALETARLAEMELSVASERRQREVAELLRDSMKTLGQSLEPRGVLRSTLQTTVGALRADAGGILLADGERLEVAAVVGAGVSLPPEGYDIARADQPEIAEALRSLSPLSVETVEAERSSPLHGLLGRAGSFVVAPLVVRGQAIGALVVIARRPSAFGTAQAEVAAALAGQGVVAYENAQLFSRVQTLAQLDELSGVANRRYFFEMAIKTFG